MKISFVWQGVSNPKIFIHWNDGLRQAMRIIEQQHEVIYQEPWDDLVGDIVLYWEAPCTLNGNNANHYKKVQSWNGKKILLFAGGPIKKEWVDGFDLLLVESKINADECEQLGIKHKTAFGINDTVFRPMNLEKVFDGIHHGTCASWKRQGLLGKALGNRAIVCGRNQETDSRPFQECKEHGTYVLPELPAEAVATLINSSHALVQTSDYWGGGQRATLEAMACGIPVICMTDSPKNREYVEESGAGTVVEPAIEAIRQAVEEVKQWTPEQRMKGYKYVQSKWTAKHYADNLLTTINELCE